MAKSSRPIDHPRANAQQRTDEALAQFDQMLEKRHTPSGVFGARLRRIGVRLGGCRHRSLSQIRGRIVRGFSMPSEGLGCASIDCRFNGRRFRDSADCSIGGQLRNAAAKWQPFRPQRSAQAIGAGAADGDEAVVRANPSLIGLALEVSQMPSKVERRSPVARLNSAINFPRFRASSGSFSGPKTTERHDKNDNQMWDAQHFRLLRCHFCIIEEGRRRVKRPKALCYTHISRAKRGRMDVNAILETRNRVFWRQFWQFRHCSAGCYGPHRSRHAAGLGRRAGFREELHARSLRWSSATTPIPSTSTKPSTTARSPECCTCSIRTPISSIPPVRSFPRRTSRANITAWA